MKIEVLYFSGCPNHELMLPHLRDLLRQAQVADPVHLVEVPDDAAAQRERFLGSPTVRIDGADVEPGAERRSDFGLKCRLYASDGKLSGAPRDEMVLEAVRRAAAL